jgi:hypothetical protein
VRLIVRAFSRVRAVFPIFALVFGSFFGGLVVVCSVAVGADLDLRLRGARRWSVLAQLSAALLDASAVATLRHPRRVARRVHPAYGAAVLARQNLVVSFPEARIVADGAIFFLYEVGEAGLALDGDLVGRSGCGASAACGSPWWFERVRRTFG